MSTLEELDFKIVINDEDFDEKVKAIRQEAQKLNTDISKLLSSFNKDATAQAKVALAQEKLNTQIHKTQLLEEKVLESKGKQEILNLKAQHQAIRNNEILNTHNRYLSNSSKIWREIKNYAMIYFSTQTVGRFVGGLVNVSAEFEKQKIALGAIVNDVIKAESLFEKLQSLAVRSPFNFTELVNYTKQLSAYNIPVNELYNTTKMLADVSAGLGVDMSRLVLAYGQVSSAEFLRGQEVRQFTEAGLPILQKLADQFSIVYNRAVSVKEVFDLISKRQVPFEMVKQVFVDLTSEGGKFFNMQEILADTLSGKISNLKDAYQIMLYEMGQKTNGIVGDSVDALRTLINNYEDVIRVVGALIATYGVFKTTQIVSYIVAQVQALNALKAAASAAEIAQIRLNVATKANVWGLVLAGIVAVSGAIYTLISHYKELSSSVKILGDANTKYHTTLSLEQTKARLLVDELQKLKKGTEEYEAKKKSLLINYGEYLSDVDKENIRIGNLAGVYNKLAQAIDLSTQAKINSFAKERANKEYEESVGSILDQFKEYADRNNFSAGIKYELQKYVLGQLDVNELSKEAFDAMQKATNSVWYNLWNGGESDRYARIDEFRLMVTKYTNDLKELSKKIDKDYKKGAEGNDPIIPAITQTEEKNFDDQINKITDLIDVYKLLMQKSDELKEHGLDGKVLTHYFPQYKDFIGKNYYDEIEQLLQSLEQLGAKGKEAADKIRLSFSNMGFDVFISGKEETEKTLKKTQEELEKLKEKYEELKKSLGENIDLKGIGAIYDISRDIKTYADEIDKIFKKKQESIEYLNKLNYTDKEKDFELNDIKRLTGQELDNALATLKDKLNTDGGKIFKEFLDTLGLPDGEWSKINPFKRFKISKMLKNVFDNEGLQKQRQVIEEMLKASGKFSQTQIDELLKPLDKGIGDEAGNALNKLKNLGRQDIEYIARNIKELTSSLTQYAEASGDSRLQEGIDVVGLLAQVGQDFAKKDWAGVVTQSAKALINTIISEISYTKQLEAQIKKTRHEVDLLDWTNMLDTDTIFGDDLIKKMSQASKVLEQINGKYQSLTDNLRNQSIGGDVVQGIESFIFSLGNIPFAIQNSMGKINAFDEAIKKGYKDLETYIVKFNDRSGLANLFGFADQYNNLRDLFASVGFDSTELGAFRSMYDKYGNLNTEGLQKILDTYDRLSNEDRAWMEEAIDYADAYKEAMDEVYSTLENVYGGAVSDLTDLMIDNWIKAGDAAGNYSNILSDVAKNYAKLMIQNTLLDKIFNEELQGKFADAFLKGDSTSAMRLFVDAIDSIEEYIPTINEILQGINNEIPLLEESSDTLSSGIKSITEETASLLASYVNAIRADVSYNKLTLKDINNDVKAILGLLPTTPTLTMYLTQIQANTYNTQLATERVVSETHNILTEIQSVIGTESGTTAIRVSM